MKKARLALGIAVAAMAAGLWVLGVKAQTERQQTKEKVSLELIWEKDFEEPVIDFSIGTTESGEYFPNVVVLSTKVLIFRDQNKKISELKGVDTGANFFSISESGNHIVHSWQYASEDAKELEECMVYVYDLAGKRIWNTPNIAPTRFPKLAPNGDYIIGPSWAEILLVTKEGVLKSINPRQDRKRSLMRIFFAISGDSQFWGINFGEPYADESVQLVVYDANANELFRKVMEPMALAYGLEISNNGEMIGAVAPEKGKNYFYLFDNKGNLLWKAGGISKATLLIVFSPADDYVLIASSGGVLKCFDTATGEAVWQQCISKEEINVYQDPGIGFIPHMEVTFSPNGNLVVVGGRNRKTNAYCFSVFENGSVVGTFYLPTSDGGFLPKANFATTGHYLYVTSGKKLLRFALRGAK